MIESVLNKIFQYIYQKRSSWYLDIVLWPSSQTAKYHDKLGTAAGFERYVKTGLVIRDPDGIMKKLIDKRPNPF